MALHGHTKIELTDVNTGEVEIYEDDNMVTDALNSFFWSQGVFVNDYLSESKWYYNGNILNQFTGGLLLFDKPLPENPEITVPVSDTILTGRGYLSVYNGLDGTIGSYNSNESALLYDGAGVKRVWDFSTSQGNGDIQSVCLTTCSGGYYGVGQETLQSDHPAVASNDAFKGGFTMSWDTGTSYLLDFNANTGETLHLLNANNCAYFSKNNYSFNNLYNASNGIAETSILKTGKLSFRKKKLPLHELSIFDYQRYGTDCSPIIEEIDVYLNGIDTIITDEMLNNNNDNSNYHFFHKITRDENSIYYMLYWYKRQLPNHIISDYINTSIAPGDIICYVWKIDLETLEAGNIIEVRNTTGYQIPIKVYIGNDKYYYNTPSYNSSDYLLSKMIVVKDKLICAYDNTDANSPQSYVTIDLANQALTTHFRTYSQLNNEYGVPAKTTTGHFYNMPLVINNKVYVYIYNVGGVVFDLENYSFALTPYTMGGINDSWSNFNIRGLSSNILGRTGGSDTASLTLYYAITPLVTINNLAKPLTKTSSQTMKVTYTIIDDEYAESIE